MNMKHIICFIILLSAGIQVCGSSLQVIPIVEDITGVYGTQTERYVWISDKEKIIGVSKKDHSHILELSLPGARKVVQCIAGMGQYLAVGTNEGIMQWDENKNAWSKDKLSKENAVDLAFDGDQLWILTAGSVMSRSPQDADGTTYTVNLLSPDEELMRIAVYHNEVWIAGRFGLYYRHADGKLFYPYQPLSPGIDYQSLAVSGRFVTAASKNGTVDIFDKFYNNKYQMPKRKKEAQLSFITALYADGRYLWMSTFDGMSVLDVLNNTWLIEEDTDDQLGAIEFFMPGNNDVYAGTENGLVRIKKPYKAIVFNQEDSFLTSTTDTVPFFFDAREYTQDEGIVFEFRQFSFPDYWQTAETMISGKTLQWKLQTKYTLNERYELRACVQKDSEKTVLDSNVIHREAGEPKIYIDPIIGIKYAGPVTLTGRVNTYTVDRIRIYPFNVSAIIDPHKRTFKAVINLKQGENHIEAELIDRLGRKARTSIKIYVKSD